MCVLRGQGQCVVVVVNLDSWVVGTCSSLAECLFNAGEGQEVMM